MGKRPTSRFKVMVGNITKTSFYFAKNIEIYIRSTKLDVAVIYSARKNGRLINAYDGNY